ncbi:MAG: hypothetical protein WBP64_19595 [Nitrososphaeraceae archaeon]
MHKSAKERRSVIFVTLALSITGFLITVALISRSDYMVSNDSTKNSIHQSESKIHGPKNFTAAARIVERSAANNSHPDTRTQVPNFSAFNPITSSNGSGSSNNNLNKTNTTSITVNSSRSDTRTQNPGELPFTLPVSKSNFDYRAKSPSNTDNRTEGTQASHTAESLIGSLMNPKTLLSSAIDEIGNSTVKTNSNKTTQTNSNKTDKIRLANPQTTTIILSNELIPAKDYLYLYDSLVSDNVTGHLVARLPCYSNMKSQLLLLTGYLPSLKSVNDEAKPIRQMSKPGLQCIYELQIFHKMFLPHGSNSSNILEIALYNPNKNPIRLPSGSSVSVNLLDSLPPA